MLKVVDQIEFDYLVDGAVAKAVGTSWEADKALLDTALLDVELVASDLQQFAERYPASIHEYLDYLRAIPRDVECILKEIGK